MNRIPIVFAFDNNLAMPAAVCLYSLLVNAKDYTQYEVYILYPQKETLNTEDINRVFSTFPRHSVKYIGIGNDFDAAFQIRGINTVTYYRLLIPELIPEHDKIIYSDVDVIFRDDLSDIYLNLNLEGKYLGVVNALAHLDKDQKEYFETERKLDSAKIFYAGNIILNSKEIRAAKLKEKFMSMIENRYRFQDMDILNITCKDKVEFLPPSFCVTTYFCQNNILNHEALKSIWTESEISDASRKGIVHYNGPKPWNSYCPNFDIWWEYYRRSPIFDEKFYFKFFYRKMEVLDTLSLWKRIKVLVRYFTVGKK